MKSYESRAGDTGPMAVDTRPMAGGPRLARLPKTKKGRVTQVTRSFSVCNSISLSKSEEIVPVVKVEPKVFEQIVKI